MSKALAAMLCLMVSGTSWADPGPAAPLSCDDQPSCRDHLAKGFRAANEKKYEEALEHYRAARSLAPSPEIIYNQGFLYSKLKKPDLARRAFEDAQHTAAPLTKELAGRIRTALASLPRPSPPALSTFVSEPARTTAAAGPESASPAAVATHRTAADSPAHDAVATPPSGAVSIPPNGGAAAPAIPLQPLPAAPNNSINVGDINIPGGVICIGHGCTAVRHSATGWIVLGAVGGTLALVGSALLIRYVGYPDPPSNIMNYGWH